MGQLHCPTRPAGSTCLKRVVVKGMQHEGSCVEANTLGDKWRMDGPRVKEVGVIADLAELHQDVDDTHEVPSCQRLLGAERETSHRVSATATVISKRKGKLKNWGHAEARE